MYRLGLSYYKIESGKGQEPFKATSVNKVFTLLKKTYPDSPYAEQTRDKIEESRRMLAEREIYIGKFYQKKKNYEAAAQRYRNVLENYSDTEYAEKARKLLRKAEEKLSEQSS